MIWIYWEGEKSPIIELCIESIKLHNENVTVIEGVEGIRELGADHIIDICQGQQVQYRSDLLRYWLLREYGGIWLDADCLCLKPLTEFAEASKQNCMVGIFHDIQVKTGWRQDQLLAVPIGAKQGSRFCDLQYNHIKGMMDNNMPIKYGWTSVGLQNRIYQNHRPAFDIKRFEAKHYSPLPWFDAPKYLEESEPLSGAWLDIKMTHLFGGTIKKLKHLSKLELLESTTLAGRIG